MCKNIESDTLNKKTEVKICEEKVGNLIFQNIRKVHDKKEFQMIVNQKISNLIKKDLSKGVAIC